MAMVRACIAITILEVWISTSVKNGLDHIENFSLGWGLGFDKAVSHQR
jgi:hypothetical protein